MHYVIITKDRDEEALYNKYLVPLGINPEKVSIIHLPHKKIKSAEMVEILKDAYEDISEQVNYTICLDADAYKYLSGNPNAESFFGYINKNKHFSGNVFYLPSVYSSKRDPGKVAANVEQALYALNKHLLGMYKHPGEGLLDKYTRVPQHQIEYWLDAYSKLEAVTCDVETLSLAFHKTGIETISFSESEDVGFSFRVEKGATESEKIAAYTYLKNFFDNYQGKIIFHNATFDVSVIIQSIYMNSLGDTEGLLKGLHAFRNMECSRIITYLATNTCSGNELSLKKQAQEFAGSWALDEISDTSQIPSDKLLEYNFIDTASTWFVYNKNYPKMVAANQEDIYERIFRPAMFDVIQMQLTGMPLNMERVKEVDAQIDNIIKGVKSALMAHPAVEQAQYLLAKEWADDKNKKLKTKQVTYEDYKEEFNLGSPKQLQTLLFEVMGLPVLEYTSTKQPATGKGVLEDLQAHAKTQEDKEFLKALIEYKDATKISSTFIPAMLDAPEYDGWHYLRGHFNLGGTVSGRLSASSPNIQQLPSTGTYAKLIKSCFQAPPGWAFVGIDADSLEDKISALTTKDPNKLKIYTEGFDGHSFRAYFYWPERFPDIDPTSADSINSIKDTHPEERQDSKGPTFALTYAGSYITLMRKFGFSEKEAKGIEDGFHELYKASDEWVDQQLQSGYSDGYVIGAFGLRLRTPLLHQVIGGTKSTPTEAEAEKRTAGNFLGQSYCMLNSRAGSEVMSQVRNSPYRLDIKPCAQIHDAQYYLVRDDIAALVFLNTATRNAMAWQDLPEIQHPTVKLSGSLGIFYPDWSNEITLPAQIDADIVTNLINKSLEKL